MVMRIEDITDDAAGRDRRGRFGRSSAFDGHAKVVYAEDPDISFRALVAIHNTARGPAFGGCRYATTYIDERPAIRDVLALSRSMTYGNALAGLDMGGGGAILLGYYHLEKPSPVVLRAMGRLIESLGGQYVAMEDKGLSAAQLKIMAEESSHVSVVPLAQAPVGHIPKGVDTKALSAQNPAFYAACSALEAIRAALAHKTGSGDIRDKRVTVRNAADPAGRMLCRMLHAQGASLIISATEDQAWAFDRVSDLVQQCKAIVVPGGSIMLVEADILVSCVGAGEIDDAAVGQIRPGIVVSLSEGALSHPSQAEALRQRGVLYIPDYVANMGGALCAGLHYQWRMRPESYPPPMHEVLAAKIGKACGALPVLFRRSREQNIDMLTLADETSEDAFWPGDVLWEKANKKQAPRVSGGPPLPTLFPGL